MVAKICNAPGCPELAPCPTHAAVPLPSNWPNIRAAVLDRDEHRCVQCGRLCPHPRHHDVDHVVPRSEGGGHDLANLRTICARSNRGARRCG